MAQIPGTIEVFSDFYKEPHTITIYIAHVTSISQDRNGRAIIGTTDGGRFTVRDTYQEVRVLISNAS